MTLMTLGATSPRTWNRRGAALIAATALAASSLVVSTEASADETRDRAVTISVAAEPRSITVNDAARTLNSVEYGLNTGTGFASAGSTNIAFDAGPARADIFMELTSLDDVTAPGSPTPIQWSDVFEGETEFSLRASSNTSRGGAPFPNLASQASPNFIPAVSGQTTALVDGVVPYPVRLTRIGSESVQRIVGAGSTDDGPGFFGPGTAAITYRYYGEAIRPSGAPPEVSIELGIRFVIEDA